MVAPDLLPGGKLVLPFFCQKKRGVDCYAGKWDLSYAVIHPHLGDWNLCGTNQRLVDEAFGQPFHGYKRYKGKKFKDANWTGPLVVF